MNQPTREEFEAYVNDQRRLEEEVRRLKEQQTEPMKEQDEMLTRIYTDVGKANTEIALLKGEVSGLRQDMQKRLDSIAQVQSLILARLPEKGE